MILVVFSMMVIGGAMRKFLLRLAFVVSIVILIISMGLMIKLGIYVDEANTSPVQVYGSELWNNMSWIRLLMSFLNIFIIGFIMTGGSHEDF